MPVPSSKCVGPSVPEPCQGRLCLSELCSWRAGRTPATGAGGWEIHGVLSHERLTEPRQTDGRITVRPSPNSETRRSPDCPAWAEDRCLDRCPQMAGFRLAIRQQEPGLRTRLGGCTHQMGQWPGPEAMATATRGGSGATATAKAEGGGSDERERVPPS